MKNKKNAFTLVELLAVIAILALIGLIAIPKVIDTINNSRNKGYLEVEKRLEEAASKYILNEYIDSDTSSITITKEQLISEGYIEEVYDLKDNSVCDAFVRVSNLDTTPRYYANVKCDSYVSNVVKIEVTIDSNNGEIVTESYEPGSVVMLEEPIKQDFTFIKWEVVSGDSILEDGNKLKVGESNTIVYAVWGNNPSFEVVLDGGVDNIDYKERYQTRTIIDLEVPTKTNYKFIRWEKVSGDGVLSGNTYTMGTEDTVIKAIWELNIFSLTVEPNGGTITQEFKTEYAVGETITLETPTRIGYTFTGWTATNGTVNDNVFTMGNGAAILTAIWDANRYTISYTLNGGTNASGNPSSGKYGSAVTVNNPSRTNYVFTGWTVSGTGASVSGTILTIGAGNITLTANWKLNTVSFSNDSWEIIVAAVQSGTYPYKVGDTKTVSLGSLGNHTLRVANTTKCSAVSVSTKTACGFVLEFADIIITRVMNTAETNVGGWPGSELRTYINRTVYNALPTALKNGIINTYALSGHGSTDNGTIGDNKNFASTDKLYLLSPREVYGTSYTSSNDTSKDTTRQLDYYQNKGVSATSYGDAIKKNSSGSASSWWMRSAYANSSRGFYLVTTSGDWDGDYSQNSQGVSPAFRLAE